MRELYSLAPFLLSRTISIVLANKLQVDLQYLMVDENPPKSLFLLNMIESYIQDSDGLFWADAPLPTSQPNN